MRTIESKDGSGEKVRWGGGGPMAKGFVKALKPINDLIPSTQTRTEEDVSFLVLASFSYHPLGNVSIMYFLTKLES